MFSCPLDSLFVNLFSVNPELSIYLLAYGVLPLWQPQAEEIAEKLCESVAASLEGKKQASFTRISSTVQVCFILLLSLLYVLPF